MTRRILGIVLLVVGIVLIFWGINASESLNSELSEFFTDSPSNKAIWLLVLGIASALLGLFFSLIPAKKQ